jgi:hypothetical protein
MIVKSKLLSASAVLACLLGAASSANATPVLDQSQLSYDIGVPFIFSPTFPDYPLGQSFTAGLSGVLADINVFANGDITGGGNTLTLDIYAGNGVGGTLLGSETQAATITYNAGLNLNVLSVNVSGLGIDVKSGSQYTFAFTNLGGSGDLATQGILGSDSNPYAGGQIYTGPGYGSPAQWDLAFQTEVSAIPEPKTSVLMLAGLALWGCIGSRRKQG